MANTIELIKKFVPLLDEIYQKEALTGSLESDASLARMGANANEIIIPKINMSGLADYDRNKGYVDGNVSLTWQTVPFNYERGRMFMVDAMDNEETQNLAFGRLAGEFLRTKVVPELDSFRFAHLASAEGIQSVTGAIATGENLIKALRAATTKMDEAQVPIDNRQLYITPTLMGMIMDLDTTKSKQVLERFSVTKQVPQTRFYTKIKLLSGKDDEEAGGYAKDAEGKNINFLIAHKPAVLCFTKHAVPKIITPEQNQDADAWKYGYRNYGLIDLYGNKKSGIYAHTEA